MKDEYKFPMSGKNGEVVMCKRDPLYDFDHYGTYWYAYRDKDGKLYYGR